MSQATGLEALTRAYKATGNPYYLQVAARRCRVQRRPPAGVESRPRPGPAFSSTRSRRSVTIINAFLQTLIGLYDYAQVSGNPVAAAAVRGR